MVASPDERNQLDEGGQLTGHIFSFNPNHLIFLCIFLNFTEATEERVRHLPTGRIFVLQCCVILLLLHAWISLLHACIPYSICSLLLDMWIVCFVLVPFS